VIHGGRQVRAYFDETTITVYQAYSDEIALPAIRSGRFVSPFKLNRMSWIKPSFLWMMYRSNWGRSQGQNRILAIKLKRQDFEHILSQAVLSAFDASVYRDQEAWAARLKDSDVRVQWDPERSLTLEKTDSRAIQIGLSGETLRAYAHQMICSITDITDSVVKLRHQQPVTIDMIPVENVYPVPADIAQTIGMDLTPVSAPLRMGNLS
jgi:hypothetical protein